MACSDTITLRDLQIECPEIYPRLREPMATASTKKDVMKIKEIRIRQLDYGYVLNVGCKEIALDKPEKILFALKQYLKDPAGTEKKFLNGELKFEK